MPSKVTEILVMLVSWLVGGGGWQDDVAWGATLYEILVILVWVLSGLGGILVVLVSRWSKILPSPPGHRKSLATTKITCNLVPPPPPLSVRAR